MQDLTKSYYKIKDVAEMLGVSQSTLRFWEKEFPQVHPVRSPKNIRYYKPEDIETLRIIYFLLKTRGLHLDAAKEQMRVNSKNVSKRLEVIDKLEDVRERLVEIRKSLNIRKI